MIFSKDFKNIQSGTLIRKASNERITRNSVFGKDLMYRRFFEGETSAENTTPY